MNDLIKDITPSELQQISTRITDGVGSNIEQSKRTIAVYLNSEVSMTYWKIGKYIAGELDAIGEEKYGSKIVATVSQQLTEQFGKGYTRAGIFRMVKVARTFPEAEIVATLSRQLTWSHFIELAEVSDPTKRLFYQQMSILYHWSVRQLRDQEDKMVYERSLIAAKPEDEQVKVLTTVADGDITPDVILKSSYVVDFLGLKRGFLLFGPITIPHFPEKFLHNRRFFLSTYSGKNHTFHRKFFQLFPEMNSFALISC